VRPVTEAMLWSTTIRSPEVLAEILGDGDGKARQVWRNVKVPGHVAEVLAAAQALRAA
jgi:peroxiredoxin